MVKETISTNLVIPCSFTHHTEYPAGEIWYCSFISSCIGNGAPDSRTSFMALP